MKKNNGLVHKIDKWLWMRGFHLEKVRTIMRNQICFLLVCLGVGLVALPFTTKILHFALGSLVFVCMFGGIAKHLLSISLNRFSNGLLFSVLLGTSIRLILVAALLYVVLIVYNASAVALACGVTASLAMALGTFAHTYLGHKQ